MIKPARLLAWGAVLLSSALACHAAAPPSPPQAQNPVAYRCKDATDVRYQAQACEGGQPMTDRDQRTDAQRRDTARAAQRDAQLAAHLHHERRHRERRQSAAQQPAAMSAAKPHRKQPNAAQDPNRDSKDGHLKRKRHFTAKPAKPSAPQTTSALPAN